MAKKRIAILTGSGISAESGLSTFRDNDGLWEKYRIEEVATPEAWRQNPQMVLDFYNARFAQLREVEPNRAHLFLAALEDRYDVQIITQNVDDLHERGGSSNILHLHGSLTTCRCEYDASYIAPMPENGLELGQLSPKKYQLRPNIVWFGEMVPAIADAEPIVRNADMLIVIGTSLNVYPAAGLAYITRENCPIVLVDPSPISFASTKPFHHIQKPATEAIEELDSILSNTFK